MLRDLTVLSFGGGQDSTAILHRLLADPVARRLYAPGHLLVLMADTGDEHPETVAHVARVRELVAALGDDTVEFHLVRGDWRVPSWQTGGLRDFMRRTRTIVIKAQRKTCTDQLKLTPLYNFLDHWIAERMGWGRLAGKRGRGKFALKQYAAARGRIPVLIGIARGEEKRVAKPGTKIPAWRQASVKPVYPLLTWGWDRADCQSFLRELDVEVPPPSNCILCPYMTEVELVWLHRYDRASYEEWVELERAKLDRFAVPCAEKGQNNLGVWGAKTLPEVLALALAKYGGWSDERLRDYKMSHGHCVQSVY